MSNNRKRHYAKIGGPRDLSPTTSKPEDIVEPKKLAWKCTKRVNKEADRSGKYYWMPVQILKLRRHLVQGTVYNMEVVLAESKTTKKDMAVRDFGPDTNPEVRDDAHKNVYEVKVWCEIDRSVLILKFDKLRSLEPGETISDGWSLL